jgi:hypothetical protein
MITMGIENLVTTGTCHGDGADTDEQEAPHLQSGGADGHAPGVALNARIRSVETVDSRGQLGPERLVPLLGLLPMGVALLE